MAPHHDHRDEGGGDGDRSRAQHALILMLLFFSSSFAVGEVTQMRTTSDQNIKRRYIHIADAGVCGPRKGVEGKERGP